MDLDRAARDPLTSPLNNSVTSDVMALIDSHDIGTVIDCDHGYLKWPTGKVVKS